ncbi:MAG: nucleotidyltransferase domain-containing protein [Micropruina sp.]
MLPMTMDVERLREVCQRYGIIRLEVFGSSARGTAGPGSDIDLLYTLAPGVRLGWEIEDLASELEAVLGRPVDLVSRRALNARILEQVLQEAQPFYAAA